VAKIYERKKPLVLIIRDGWGIGDGSHKDATIPENTPYTQKLLKEYPHSILEASGEAVGLPKGQMGNSEVGHLNIGAGRIVYQDIIRIQKAIDTGEIEKNETFMEALSYVKKRNTRLHFLGLASDGGVHSDYRQLLGMIKIAKKNGIKNIFLHLITDGRDTPPKSAVKYVSDIKNFLQKERIGRIATIVGRYYAMDRDKRWERTKLAYELYTLGIGREENDPIKAIEKAYELGETDEFIKPVAILYDGKKDWMIKDGDVIIFFNFRGDRARQITASFVLDEFDGFLRNVRTNVDFYCLTMYDENLPAKVIFPPIHLENIFGEVISREGLRQLRIAETEKYAHVTYFFNGGEEKAFPNEDRKLVPSPKVATYDLKPEMSAYEVYDEVIKRLDSGIYDVVILNFANPDMVGHTGVYEAAVKAVKVVDELSYKVAEKTISLGGIAIITADHGNCEMMIDDDGSPHTAHTTNPVNFILVSNDDNLKKVKLKDGKLGDIAPTMLYLLGIDIPPEMTGNVLL
jgi:2,3-bisphosphoglycerate-independent phosphoglycerate mutase